MRWDELSIRCGGLAWRELGKLKRKSPFESPEG
jgi:hypothetical protein